MARDQVAEGARVRTGLPLDIDDPQRARPLGFMLQPLAQPALKNLDPLHRIAEAWVAPIKAVENMEFVGSRRRTGDGIDRRHAAAGMRRQDEAAETKFGEASSSGELFDRVVDEPVEAAIEQGGEIVIGAAEPIAARQEREGGPGAAGQVEAAARHLLGERHVAALLGKTVQMHDDIERRRRFRRRVPAQKQIRLGSRMRAQHRRLGQIRLARGDALAGYWYLAKRVWMVRHWFDTAPPFQSRRLKPQRESCWNRSNEAISWEEH